MNFSLKRVFTPSKSQLKKKSLQPLSGLSPSAIKNNPLDAALHGDNGPKPKKSKNKKGQFTIGNLKIKDFTDKEIQDTFKCFDLDGNGYICAAEIKQCFKKLGEKITDQEVDEMIKMCDQVLLFYNRTQYTVFSLIGR